MKTQAWEELNPHMKEVGKRLDDIFSEIQPEHYPLLIAMLKNTEGTVAERCGKVSMIFQDANLLRNLDAGKSVVEGFTEKAEEYGIPTAMVIQANTIIVAEEGDDEEDSEETVEVDGSCVGEAAGQVEVSISTNARTGETGVGVGFNGKTFVMTNPQALIFLMTQLNELGPKWLKEYYK